MKRIHTYLTPGRLLLVALLGLAVASAVAAPVGEKCRGAYLRSEITKVGSELYLQPSLVILPRSNQPSLKLEVYSRDTFQEVKLYETRLRKYTVNDSQTGGVYEYASLPDEIWKESPETLPPRPRKTGILTNAVITVNGRKTTTDGNGCIPFSDIQLLETFDRLDNTPAAFTITAANYRPVTFICRRTIPRRKTSDEKTIDEPLSHDFLNAYQLDFRRSEKEPEHEKLDFSYCMPDDVIVVRCGQMIPLTVTVKNNGLKATSCLMGRLFSRVPGMNGRLFYFGAIPPGGSASFIRYISVDSDNLTSDAFGEIHFEDSWGEIKSHLKFRLPVVH